MKFARLAVTLQAVEPVHLSRYKAAVLRGGFGLAFRRVTCPFPKQDCLDCLLRQTCVWSYVFDTPRPKEARIMPKAETVPHPFVIEPPEQEKTQLDKGEELSFNLILIGRAIDYLPYFILTFEQMAEQGLGPGRGKLKVKSVSQNRKQIYEPETKTLHAPLTPQRLTFSSPSDPSSQLTLHFLTPTRIIYQGKMVKKPEFPILLRSLLRRITLLAYFHDQPITTDYTPLIRQSEVIKTVAEDLAELSWRRFSRRQKSEIPMSGIIGTITYRGEITPFLPYLRAGEILHIGKGTSFGMGKYKMEVK